MAKHTQGEWKRKTIGNDVVIYSGDYYGAEDSFTVAVFKDATEEDKANAAIISYAPLLLKHLKHLAGACERFAPQILTDEANAVINAVEIEA
jgi:hypothetical protein